MKLYCIINIFDRHIFDNETIAILKFFQISTESILFLCFFWMKASLLMIHLNANLNSLFIIHLSALC